MVKRDFEEKQKPAKSRRSLRAEALKRGKNAQRLPPARRSAPSSRPSGGIAF